MTTATNGSVRERRVASVSRRRGRLRWRHLFSFAYRHVRSGWGRTLLSLFAIALGVALVVAFQLMNAAVLSSFLDSIDSMTGRAQLVVSAGDGLSFSEDVVDTVKQVAGVKLAVPLVRSSAFPDDGSGEMLTVQGIDLANESAIRVYHDSDKPEGSPNGVIDDMVEFLNSPDSILLGREFAERRHLHKGDRLALVTPGGVRSFTIKGLLAARGVAETLRGRVLVMDLFAAQRSFTADRMINQIDILVQPGVSLEEARQRITAALPPGLKVEEPLLRKNIIRGTVAGFQAMITAFSLLSIFAGFLICYSRLSTIFDARIWEIGVMRAVGLSSRRVTIELLKESILVGVIGTAAGMFLGTLIGTYALPFLAQTTAIAFRMPTPSGSITLQWSALLFGAVVGAVATLGGAWIPARRAAALAPIVALRLRGRELHSAPPAWRLPLQMVLVVVIVAGMLIQAQTQESAFGIATTAAMAALACTLAAPLVRQGGALLDRLWQRAFGTLGAIAAKQVAQRSRRATLVVVSLGIGFGLVLMLGTLEWSFERTLAYLIPRQNRAHLIVSGAATGGGEWGAPLHERLIAEIGAMDGIAIAGGEQSRQVREGSADYYITSLDPLFFRDPRAHFWALQNGAQPQALERIANGDAVLVTRSYARAHGTRPGDYVELASPHGLQRFLVAAVSEGPVEAAVCMSRVLYRQLWNDPTLLYVRVVLDDPAAVATVEAAIAARFAGRERFEIRSIATLTEYYVGKVRDAFAVQNLLALTVFILVAIAIGDALASSVVERTREFGMLRAIACSSRDIAAIILYESGAIAVLGLVLALLTGMSLGVFWVWVEFPALVGWVFDLHVPLGFVLAIALTTVAVCLLGALLPALRAARLPVAQAMRAE